MFDVADLYKAKTTVPLVCVLHSSENPERDARFRLRRDLKLYRLIPKIVQDVQTLLAPDASDSPSDREIR